jgi:hypothetical protein
MEVNMHAFRHFAAPVAALCISAGVIGCSSEPKPEQVPVNAQLLVQGDQHLAYTAPQAGNVYVYDASDRTLLYSGRVEKGQSISIDPDEDKIMVDNRLALEKDIHAGNRHRIYFLADPAEERVVEKTTVTERTASEQVAPADTTIQREETKKVETNPDGDVTVKKETTIKAD